MVFNVDYFEYRIQIEANLDDDHPETFYDQHHRRITRRQLSFSGFFLSVQLKNAFSRRSNLQVNHVDWSALKENLESTPDPVFGKVALRCRNDLNLCRSVEAILSGGAAIFEEETPIKYEVGLCVRRAPENRARLLYSILFSDSFPLFARVDARETFHVEIVEAPFVSYRARLADGFLDPISHGFLRVYSKKNRCGSRSTLVN